MYPENQGSPEPAVDEDRTQLTSDRDLNQLVKKLRSQQGGGGGGGLPEESSEVHTEIVRGAELDKIRMMEALQNELGPAGENDGTVEMQNPYAIWKGEDAPGANAAAGSAPEADDVTQNELVNPVKPKLSLPSAMQEPASAGPAAGPPKKSRGAGGPPPLPGAPKRPSAPEPAPAAPASTGFDGTDGAATDEASAAPDIDPDHDGPWKLKTNFGLTYEFPDTKSLRGWLNSREELDGYTLSMGGPDFFLLTDFPQLERGSRGLRTSQSMPSVGAGGSGSHRAMSSSGINRTTSSSGQYGAAGSGSFDAVGGYDASTTGSGTFEQPAPAQPPTGPRVTNEYRPPSNAAKWDKVAWLVFFVLVPIAAAAAVQNFGIYDIKGLILGTEEPAEPAPIPRPAPAVTSAPDEGASAALAAALEADREQVDWLLKDAQQQIESNRLQSALEKIEKAELLAPASVELLKLKAEVLEGLGQPEKATEARDQAQALAAKADAAAAESDDDLDGADDAAVTP